MYGGPALILYLLVVKASITFRENNCRSQCSLEIVEVERSDNMPRYSKKAGQEVKKAMHERKRGTLKSGKAGKKVTSRKQAIAIALSKARKKGAKVPRKKSSK